MGSSITERFYINTDSSKKSVYLHGTWNLANPIALTEAKPGRWTADVTFRNSPDVCRYYYFYNVDGNHTLNQNLSFTIYEGRNINFIDVIKPSQSAILQPKPIFQQKPTLLESEIVERCTPAGDEEGGWNKDFELNWF
ncbi:hypothetical protein IFR05_015707 [Cadophora sp. M221]|nr:hypothetical protein IFR05_015707 [Cadophora sp. M221]